MGFHDVLLRQISQDPHPFGAHLTSNPEQAPASLNSNTTRRPFLASAIPVFAGGGLVGTRPHVQCNQAHRDPRILSGTQLGFFSHHPNFCFGGLQWGWAENSSFLDFLLWYTSASASLSRPRSVYFGHDDCRPGFLDSTWKATPGQLQSLQPLRFFVGARRAPDVA